MIRYKATTPTAHKTDKEGRPVEAYHGRTYGVRFDNNVAHFDDISINKELGLTAEQVASAMVKDFGYTVVQIDEHGVESPFIPSEKAVKVEAVVPAPKPASRKKVPA